MSNNELGYLRGDICGRGDCSGVIDEGEKEGSCSCHIHPPCGYCTTDTAYCPECGWEPSDDIKPVDPEIEKRNQEYYQRENEKWQKRRDLFEAKFQGKEPITELEIRCEPHTHFTQIQRGVFPKGTQTKASIESKVKGTFGGRFNLFSDYRFEYVAYTD